MFGAFFGNVQSGVNNTPSLYSYRMSGTSEYLSMSNPFPLFSGYDINYNFPASFQFLIKLDNTSSRGLFSTLIDAWHGFFINVTTSGTLHASIRSDVNKYSGVSTTTPLTTGTWYNVIVTTSDISYGNSYKIYVNSVNQTLGTISNTFTSVSLNSELQLGAAYNTINYFYGDYNHCIIYDYELTSTEVTKIYNLGKPLTNYNPSHMVFRTIFDNDTWDSGNSRFNVINDFGTDGISVNLVEADKVLSSPY